MRQRLNGLTSLRFFAAAMVLLQHTKLYLATEPSWIGRVLLDHGVSFFFVLSGFILAYSYPSFSRRSDETRFLVARFARLWPVHVACILVLFITFPLEQLAPPTELWRIVSANLLMVHAWIPEQSLYFSLNTVSWSISTEFFFYLCYPILIRDWERTWPRKLVFASVLLISLIAYGNWCKLPGFSDVQTGLTTHGLIYINPLSRLFEFVLGMVGFVLWKQIQRFGASIWFVTLAEVISCGVAAYWLLFQPLTSAFASQVGRAGREWLGHSGSCFAFAFLIPFLAQNRGWVSRLLSAPFLVTLGEISYSIYLVHPVILKIMETYFPSRLVKLDLIGISALWVFIFAIAYLSWKFIEMPARRSLLKAWDAATRRREKPEYSEARSAA